MSRALIDLIQSEMSQSGHPSTWNRALQKAIDIIGRHEAEQSQDALNTSSKPLNIEHVSLMLDGIERHAASAKRVIVAYQEAI